VVAAVIVRVGVRKPPFLRRFVLKIIFFQDRLATNIGEALKKVVRSPLGKDLARFRHLVISVVRRRRHAIC
jgi:hypothetical protein